MALVGGMSSGDPQQLQAFTERLRAASRHVHSTSDALVGWSRSCMCVDCQHEWDMQHHIYTAAVWQSKCFLAQHAHLCHVVSKGIDLLSNTIVCCKQVNAKLLVAFTRIERYGLALSYFQPVFAAIEAHCQAQSSVQGLLVHCASFARKSCLMVSYGF
jgi:hypothetical protein